MQLKHIFDPSAFKAANNAVEIIIKSLDPLRAKKTFIRKKLGHTAVSAQTKRL